MVDGRDEGDVHVVDRLKFEPGVEPDQVGSAIVKQADVGLAGLDDGEDLVVPQFLESELDVRLAPAELRRALGQVFGKDAWRSGEDQARG